MRLGIVIVVLVVLGTEQVLGMEKRKKHPEVLPDKKGTKDRKGTAGSIADVLGDAGKASGNGMGDAGKASGKGIGDAGKASGKGMGDAGKASGKGMGDAGKASGKGMGGTGVVENTIGKAKKVLEEVAKKVKGKRWREEAVDDEELGDFDDLWGKVKKGGKKGNHIRDFDDRFNAKTKENRYKLFKGTRKKLGEMKMKKPNMKFHLKANFFAMMTEVEKALYCGVNITLNEEQEKNLDDQKPGHKEKPERHRLIGRRDKKRGKGKGRDKRQTATSFNWVDYGAVSAVKNQGLCGSCWAYGAVAVVEGAYVLATEMETPKSFSEQQVVDCNEEYACAGGWWPTVWKQIIKTQYIPLEVNYAYEGLKATATCDLSISSSATVKNEAMITENGIVGSMLQDFTVMRELNDEGLMISNMLAHGPLSICILVDDYMYFYEDGIIDSCIGANCNHLVTLVGYEETALVIKNSWGTEWGILGYFKIQRGCGEPTGPSGLGYSYWASYVSMIATATHYEVINIPTLEKATEYTITIENDDVITIKGTDVAGSTSKWYVIIGAADTAAYRFDYFKNKDTKNYRHSTRLPGSTKWVSRVFGTISKLIDGSAFELMIKSTASGFEANMDGEALNAYTMDKPVFAHISVGGSAAEFTVLHQSRLREV